MREVRSVSQVQLYVPVSTFTRDDSKFPYVRVVFPAVFEDEDFRALFDWYLGLHRRAAAEGVKIAYLIDLSAVNPLLVGASRRKLAAENVKRNKEALRRYTLCEARVVSQPLSRGMLTAVDWLAAQPWSVRNFADRREAKQWVIAQMRDTKPSR